MKKILVASFILFSSVCRGQDTSGIGIVLTSKDSLCFKYPLMVVGSLTFDTLQRRLDTIPCIMLISDTSTMLITNYASESPLIYHSPSYKSNNWMKGYVVKPGNPYLVYLDEYKQPLSENVIVWMSKEIKQLP